MKRKLCYTCQETKCLSQFNKNRVRADGYNSICRTCSNARSRQYYSENRAHHLKVIRKQNEEYRARNQRFVFDYLLQHPCVDCGETDPLVLEFDHRRDKKVGLSTAVSNGWTLDKIVAEIKKCQIRCSNCHKRRTARVQKHYKVRMLEELKGR